MRWERADRRAPFATEAKLNTIPGDDFDNGDFFDALKVEHDRLLSRFVLRFADLQLKVGE